MNASKNKKGKKERIKKIVLILGLTYFEMVHDSSKTRQSKKIASMLLLNITPLSSVVCAGLDKKSFTTRSSFKEPNCNLT
jgi:hypothetical protein